MNRLKNFLLKLFFPNAVIVLQTIGDQRDEAVYEHALCLDALMSLVAINEQGSWATVRVEDTVLPEDVQVYLHELVARA